MAIDNNITIISEGNSSDLLSEIQDEIYSFEVFLEQVNIASEDLRPEFKNGLERMQEIGREAETIFSKMYVHEQKSGDIERNPGIQKILDQEKRLNTSRNPRDKARIRREINHLESLHAKPLEILESNKQNATYDRLRLIYCWISVLNYEIHILDECKSVRIRQIISLANGSGDESLITTVRKKLKALSIHDSIIEELKVDLEIQGNTDIEEVERLLNQYLDDVQKVTKALTNKKQIVRILHDISKETRREIVNPPPEPSIENQVAAIEIEKNNVSPPGDARQSHKEIRMAFFNRGK